MKKLFSSIFALSLAIAGFSASAETALSPEATPEAKAEPTAMEAPAPEQAPAVSTASNASVPQAIADHLALRFPGKSVEGVHREGVTYVVDLSDGEHIRYDNCYNPICYGVHNHDCIH